MLCVYSGQNNELDGQRSGRNIQESRLKWYGSCIEKRRRICGQESDGDGCAWEKKERKTKADIVG